MSFDTWIYYLLAVLILTASPGPSSLLCMTKGVQSGFKLSIFTALGSVTAITGILTLSFTGLGVIIASSDWCLISLSGRVQPTLFISVGSRYGRVSKIMTSYRINKQALNLLKKALRSIM